MRRGRAESCCEVVEEIGHLVAAALPQLNLHHVSYTPRRPVRQLVLTVVEDEELQKVGAGGSRRRRLSVGVLRRSTATNEGRRGPLHYPRLRHRTLAMPNDAARLWCPFGLADSNKQLCRSSNCRRRWGARESKDTQ